ncbi:hypothetical protein CCVT_0438 [Campylobacter curvus]|nr:hypothetical protein CCVT_0438 [Campylobacter curvus]
MKQKFITLIRNQKQTLPIFHFAIVCGAVSLRAGRDSRPCLRAVARRSQSSSLSCEQCEKITPNSLSLKRAQAVNLTCAPSPKFNKFKSQTLHHAINFKPKQF